MINKSRRAEGAASIQAWGNAPGIVLHATSSAEGAIHLTENFLSRAFRAYNEMRLNPGGTPQAKIEVASLAATKLAGIRAPKLCGT
jgi:hypothetical protein